jgi:hypothetical protein
MINQNMPYNLKWMHLQKNLQFIKRILKCFCKDMQMLMLDSFKNSCKKNNKVVFKQPKHNYLWKKKNRKKSGKKQ